MSSQATYEGSPRCGRAAGGASPEMPRGVKAQLKDRLHGAQVALLEKTEERHAMYAPSKTSKGSTPLLYAQGEKSQVAEGSKAFRATSEALAKDGQQPAEKVLQRSEWVSPKAKGSGAAVRFAGETSRTFQRSLSVGDTSPNPLTSLSQGLSKRFGKSMAYMGIDWYEIQERRHKLSWVFFAQNLYYYCYAGYIVSVVTIGAIAMWVCDPHRLSLSQALYSSAACVSQSGLAVVDWSKQSNSTYIISFVLILMGSAPLLHMAPVVLRLYSFRMQAKMTERLRKESLSSEDLLKDPGNDIGSLSKHLWFSRRTHSDPCLNVNTRVEPLSQSCVKQPLLEHAQTTVNEQKEEPKKHAGHGHHRKKGKYSETLDEMHRLEYKALRKVLKIMIGYWLTCHIIGASIFFAYFHLGSEHIRGKLREDNISRHWLSMYLTVSSFQNNGLTFTSSSVMGFAHSPILLNTIGALILLGNTCLPIMIRLIAWFLERHSVPGSEHQRVLDFLLEHPRRCFTHMFPSVHTLWLLLVVLLLNASCTAVILWQDAYDKAMDGLGPADTFWNALFQSISARTAGLNSVNIAYLSQGTTFFLVVMMYLATTPTVVVMRFSAVVGGDAGTDLDITGRVEGVEEDLIKADNSLKTQARRYLTQDVTYLTVILFLICAFEKNQFFLSAKYGSPLSDGIYGDFSFFKVLFELASAYGTCGLSLGFQNQTMSFSGVWSPASQLLLVFVMVLGRLRGLPDSIDPSVRVAMTHHDDAERAFVLA